MAVLQPERGGMGFFSDLVGTGGPSTGISATEKADPEGPAFALFVAEDQSSARAA